MVICAIRKLGHGGGLDLRLRNHSWHRRRLGGWICAIRKLGHGGGLDLRRRSDVVGHNDVVGDGFNRLGIDDHCRHSRHLGVHQQQI